MTIGYYFDDIEKAAFELNTNDYEDGPIGGIHSDADSTDDDSCIGGMHGEFREKE